MQIDMMISGNGPVSAVTYLSDFKLFEVVFAIPSSSDPTPTENCGRFVSFPLLYIQDLKQVQLCDTASLIFAITCIMYCFFSLCRAYMEAIYVEPNSNTGLVNFTVSY